MNKSLCYSFWNPYLLTHLRFEKSPYTLLTSRSHALYKRTRDPTWQELYYRQLPRLYRNPEVTDSRRKFTKSAWGRRCSLGEGRTVAVSQNMSWPVSEHLFEKSGTLTHFLPRSRCTADICRHVTAGYTRDARVVSWLRCARGALRQLSSAVRREYTCYVTQVVRLHQDNRVNISQVCQQDREPLLLVCKVSDQTSWDPFFILSFCLLLMSSLYMFRLVM